jgi:hypothetical protein
MNNKTQITSGKYDAATGLYEKNPFASSPPEADVFVPGHQEREPTVDPSVFEEMGPPIDPPSEPDNKTPSLQPVPIDLKYVQDKARRLVAIEDRLEEIAAEEKVLKEEQRQIRIFQLPEAMFELDIKPPIIGVGNRLVEVVPLVTASLPAKEDPDKRQKAINAVIDLGLGGNVRRALEIDFPNDAIVEHKILDAISAIDKDLKPRISATIHHATYTSMISKLIAAGKAIDRDLLGVWVGNIARVKKVKND